MPPAIRFLARTVVDHALSALRTGSDGSDKGEQQEEESRGGRWMVRTFARPPRLALGRIRDRIGSAWIARQQRKNSHLPCGSGSYGDQELAKKAFLANMKKLDGEIARLDAEIAAGEARLRR